VSISAERAQRHIEEQALRIRGRGGVSAWAHSLFHTTNVTNAVKIAHSGVITPREALRDFDDVANQAALHANKATHGYARLYFMPKNGYHLKTEGIKLLGDPNRVDPHNNIPVAFVFDLAKVLTHPGVVFSAGNPQSTRYPLMDGDQAFASIDFDKVYHDRPVTPEEKDLIHKCRQAEVLVSGGLPLHGFLRAVCFRSQLDRRTFLHLCRQRGAPSTWPYIVETRPTNTFLMKGLSIKTLNLIGDVLDMSLALPSFGPYKQEYLAIIEQVVDGNLVARFDGVLPSRMHPVEIPGFSKSDHSVFTCYLENSLAFSGSIASTVSRVY
jgi:hypothetical protein